MKISLYGEPGTGKTTVMLRLFDLLLGDGYTRKLFDFGLLKGEVFSKEGQCIWVAGVYDGSLFQGTDRLSMAVQPHAIKFIGRANGSILIEGERLFKGSFLKAIQPDEIFLLEAPEPILIDRRKARGSEQTEQCLKGRRTLINNIVRDFTVKTLQNTVEADIETNAQLLKTLLEKK